VLTGKLLDRGSGGAHVALRFADDQEFALWPPAPPESCPPMPSSAPFNIGVPTLTGCEPP